jgi:hypothetical protein
VIKSASRSVLIVVACLSFVAGCVQKSKRPSKDDRELAAKIVATSPPAVSHPLDIHFQDKVKLIGYDVSAPEMRAGKVFSVTWYWQVLSPLEPGWQLFTHLADASNASRLNLDAVRPVRSAYPEANWKAGEYIKDTQQFTLPPDWESKEARFYIGFWKEARRLHVAVGPQDGKNRALALTVPVASGAAQGSRDALPRLIARRLTGQLVLDGQLDEPDWREAQPSGGFVQTMTGATGAFVSEARVLYDAKNLYVGYHVADELLKTTFRKPDDHLWEQDCVELMVDPDGDGLNYFEIQVSPAGIVFDTRYDSRRKPLPFGDLAWSSRIDAKVLARGTMNDDRNDEGYAVEAAIPWSAFAAGPTPAEPPAAGSEWRVNFFVMDAMSKGQRAVGWSPPMVGDFHTLDRFGRVVFPQAAVAPEAAKLDDAKPPLRK